MLGGAATFNRWMGDVARSSVLIMLVGGGFTYLQGLLWVVLMESCVMPVVVFSIFCAVVVPMAAMLFCFAKVRPHAPLTPPHAPSRPNSSPPL
jgi:hypothetical protein